MDDRGGSQSRGPALRGCAHGQVFCAGPAALTRNGGGGAGGSLGRGPVGQASLPESGARRPGHPLTLGGAGEDAALSWRDRTPITLQAEGSGAQGPAPAPAPTEPRRVPRSAGHPGRGQQPDGRPPGTDPAGLAEADSVRTRSPRPGRPTPPAAASPGRAILRSQTSATSLPRSGASTHRRTRDCPQGSKSQEPPTQGPASVQPPTRRAAPEKGDWGFGRRGDPPPAVKASPG